MRTWLFPALLVMSACGGSPDAVWLVYLGAQTAEDSSATCAENFNAAECPASPDDPEPGEWTERVTEESNESAVFVQILDLPGGEKVLVAGTDLFVGEKDGGSWRFTWSSFQTESWERKHASGYVISGTSESTETTTFVLDLAGAEATGTLEYEEVSEETVTESDTWNADEVGFDYGDVFEESPIRLEGEQFNVAESAECTGGSCEIVATQTVRGSAPIRAVRTDLDREGFDGVYGASQE